MKKMSDKKFNKLRTEFLSEALEIVERPTAPLGSIVIWIVFVLLVAFFVWACIGKMDEVATGRGMIIADEGVQEVQSAGTGVVKEIKVKEGDRVHRGDVLYSMEKDIEQKTIDYSEGEMGLLQLRIDLIGRMLQGKRLEGYDTSKYTGEQKEVIEALIVLEKSNQLAVEEREIAVEMAKNRENLADKNQESNNQKKDYLEEQKKIQDTANNTKSSSSVELELLEDRKKFAKSEVDKYQKLYDAGAKSKVELDNKKNELNEIEKQIEIGKIKLKEENLQKKQNENEMDYRFVESESENDNIEASKIDSKQNYDTAVKELENLKKQQSEQLYDMKSQYMEELKKYDVQIAEQYSQFENKEIVAQYDGVVKRLVVDKVSSVVTATQVVAEIIPDSATMIVEAQMKNSDIGYIEEGQKVDIKVDTFNYQKYGKLSGEVIYISPDAIENEQKQQLYKVNVLLDKDSSSKIDVSQGMECTVEVKTDRRRIIEFFLEPLVDALDKGLKER